MLPSRRLLRSFQLVIVGAGFFGLTIAEMYTRLFDKEVLVIDKRNHIGGNAWSEIDQSTGIEYHKYGSHIFHTNRVEVWNYVNFFSKFNSYIHRVWTVHDSQLYSLPINLHTLSQFYGRVVSPHEAQILLEREKISSGEKQHETFEAKAISSVGRELYEAFFKGYTEKQWGISPRELPAGTFTRLPVRLSLDSRYFSDVYQGIPELGYQGLFNNMISNKKIKVMLELDFEHIRSDIDGDTLVVYTGAIDNYFRYVNGNLRWRTVDFKFERLNIPDFQGNSVINYSDIDVEYTRIHEFKHLHPERLQHNHSTLIAKEYSRPAQKCDDPYYPVNSPQDRALIHEYRRMAKREKNVIFGGRLGSYKYLDMHMAIASAFLVFKKHISSRQSQSLL